MSLPIDLIGYVVMVPLTCGVCYIVSCHRHKPYLFLNAYYSHPKQDDESFNVCVDKGCPDEDESIYHSHLDFSSNQPPKPYKPPSSPKKISTPSLTSFPSTTSQNKKPTPKPSPPTSSLIPKPSPSPPTQEEPKPKISTSQESIEPSRPSPEQFVRRRIDPFDAAYRGSLEDLQYWLNYHPKASVEEKNLARRGTPLLYTAARENHVHIVKWLLDNKADVNSVQSDTLSTALHGVSFAGHLETCKVLIEHKADIAACNIYEELPIDNAIESSNKNFQLLSYLAKQHIEQGKPSVLRLGINAKYKRILEKLAAGDPSDLVYWKKQKWLSSTELFIISAVSTGDIAMIEELTEKHSINLANIRDQNGGTLLHVAASGSKSYSVIEWLINRNIDVNVPNLKTLSTPLHIAASSARPEACRLLIDLRADCNVRNNAGKTPFQEARSYKKITQLLYPYTNFTEKDLFEYAKAGNLEFVLYYFNSYQPDINKKCDNKTLLHVITEKNPLNQELLSFLLSQEGIDINILDGDGNTPLLCAILKNQPYMADALLKRKCNTAIKNNTGKDAETLARELNRWGVLKYFQKDDYLDVPPDHYHSLDFTVDWNLHRKSIIEKLDNPYSDLIIGEENEPFVQLQVKLMKKAVKVDPMLVAELNKMKTIDFSELSGIPEKMDRIQVPISGANCFKIEGFLTEKECQYLIDETNKVGYDSLGPTFDPTYRSNDRLLFSSEQLADILWKRLALKLERKDVFNVRPVGFGNEGTWHPYRLNECFKFGKYEEGGHFSPHMDGPWVPREDESSIYTIVVYLNEDFSGGSTKFCGMQSTKCDTTVVPKRGTALVFNHDILHEGSPVLKGTKYILRSEVMFRRTDTHLIPESKAKEYENRDEYLKTIKLYRASQKAQREGDSLKFTEKYLEALHLQLSEQRSLGKDNVVSSNIIEGLPIDAWILLFSNFTASQLSPLFTVSKNWFRMLRDGELWHNLYRKRWPSITALEENFCPRKVDNSTIDWYGAYWSRTIVEQDARPVVFDLGSFQVKGGIIEDGAVRVHSIESVVAKLPDIYDFHGRRSSWSRFFCGAHARKTYPDRIDRIIQNGVLLDCSLLPEIITGFFYYIRKRPFTHPIVLAEPPGCWDGEQKRKLDLIFQGIFRVPSIHYIPAPSLVLFSVQCPTGVVISLGYESGYVASVVKGVMKYFEKIPSLEITDPQIVEITQKIIKQTTPYENTQEYRALSSHVICSGGGFVGNTRVNSLASLFQSDITIIENPEPIFDVVIGGAHVSSLGWFKSLVTEGVEFSPEVRLNRRNREMEDTYMDFYASVISTHFYWFNRNFEKMKLADD